MGLPWGFQGFAVLARWNPDVSVAFPGVSSLGPTMLSRGIVVFP